MFSFRAVVADPLRLGREFRFDVVDGNCMYGSDYESGIELEFDITKGRFSVVQFDSPYKGNFVNYFAESRTEYTAELGTMTEEQLKEWAKPIKDYDEISLKLHQQVRKLLQLIPLGEACIDIIEMVLRPDGPEVGIFPSENCPFDYDFMVDGESVTLEDFILEVQRQADE